MTLQIHVLKDEFKKAIKGDPILMATIAAANHKKNSTIETWIREDDPMLTTATNLKIIRDFLRVSEGVELTGPKQAMEDKAA